MKEDPTPRKATARLRRLAKARLAEGLPKPPQLQAGANPERLVQELEIHRIELDLQNQELRQAKLALESLLAKYTDLYDFAPCGYFSLDEQGGILEANLTGATLFGVERSRLVSRNFAPLLAAPSRLDFRAFLARVFAQPGRHSCEAAALRADGPFWVALSASPALLPHGARRCCRVAVVDITGLKRAEEAQIRLDALSLVNRELNEEIARRRTVEEALRLSEQRTRQFLLEGRGMQEQLRRLSHQIILAQEEERKHISRDLHDDLSQTLTGIHVLLANLASKSGTKPRDLERTVLDTQRLVEEAVDVVHRFARELRPAVLDDLGLLPALTAHFREFTQRTGLRIDFTASAWVKTGKLNNDQRTALYRVAQEALKNVANHARANRVKVSLLKLPRTIRLVVADDGRAFDVEKALSDKSTQRLGLLGMRERIAMVGGEFSIASIPQRGTTVQAEIPLRPPRLPSRAPESPFQRDPG